MNCGAIGHFHPRNASVLVSAADPVVVAPGDLQGLIGAARVAPQGRARFLLHANEADLLHEMVIALPPDSCDHPHVNFKSGKSFLALSGRFAVVTFSDDGARITPIVLSAGPWPGARVVRLREPQWHTILPLDGDTIFLETILGPFEGNRFAPWFPTEADPRLRADWTMRLSALCRSAAHALA